MTDDRKEPSTTDRAQAAVADGFQIGGNVSFWLFPGPFVALFGLAALLGGGGGWAWAMVVSGGGVFAVALVLVLLTRAGRGGSPYDMDEELVDDYVDDAALPVGASR